MIDGAAARGQAGTVLVLAGTGLPGGELRATPAVASLPRGRGAAAGPGQDFTARMIAAEALAADVTDDDRALVDRFLDMMAAEAGASRNTLAAYRNDLERAAETLGGSLASAGSRRALAASASNGRPRAGDRGAAVGGAAALLRLPGRRGAAQRRPVGGAAAPARSSGRCRGSSTRHEVDAMFEAAEDRAASGEPLALRNLALLELLYGSGLRASELVSLAARRAARRASRS